MTRTAVLIRGQRFRGPAYRALSQGAQWLYQHFHFESDLTMLGTLTMNVNRWALAAAAVDIGEINRELSELEQAGFILMESCTQELFIADFLADRPPFRHRNHLTGALRVIESIESERLRAAVYETSLPLLEDAMKRFENAPIQPPGQPPGKPPASTLAGKGEVEDGYWRTDHSEQRAQKRRASTGRKPNDQREEQEDESSPSRVEQTLIILAKRDFDGAKARGTVMADPEAYFRKCLGSQRLRNAPTAASFAAEHPDYPPSRLANCIEPPETITPPMYVPEGVGQGVGFGKPLR